MFTVLGILKSLDERVQCRSLSRVFQTFDLDSRSWRLLLRSPLSPGIAHFSAVAARTRQLQDSLLGFVIGLDKKLKQIKASRRNALSRRGSVVLPTVLSTTSSQSGSRVSSRVPSAANSPERRSQDASKNASRNPSRKSSRAESGNESGDDPENNKDGSGEEDDSENEQLAGLAASTSFDRLVTPDGRLQNFLHTPAFADDAQFCNSLLAKARALQERITKYMDPLFMELESYIENRGSLSILDVKSFYERVRPLLDEFQDEDDQFGNMFGQDGDSRPDSRGRPSVGFAAGTKGATNSSGPSVGFAPGTTGGGSSSESDHDFRRMKERTASPPPPPPRPPVRGSPPPRRGGAFGGGLGAPSSKPELTPFARPNMSSARPSATAPKFKTDTMPLPGSLLDLPVDALVVASEDHSRQRSDHDVEMLQHYQASGSGPTSRSGSQRGSRRGSSRGSPRGSSRETSRIASSTGRRRTGTGPNSRRTSVSKSRLEAKSPAQSSTTDEKKGSALGAHSGESSSMSLVWSRPGSPTSAVARFGNDNSEEDLNSDSSDGQLELGVGSLDQAVRRMRRQASKMYRNRQRQIRRNQQQKSKKGATEIPNTRYLLQYISHHRKSFAAAVGLVDTYLLGLMILHVALVLAELLEKKSDYAAILAESHQMASHLVRRGLSFLERLLIVEPTFISQNLLRLQHHGIEKGAHYSVPRQLVRKCRLLHCLFFAVDVVLFPTSITAHDGGVKALCGSILDPNFVLSGGYDCAVRIWDVKRNVCLAQYGGHESVVTWVRFVQNDTVLISASLDATIRVWNAKNAKCTYVMTGHTGGVIHCAVSSNERYLASGSMDCTVRLWDYQSGSCLRIFRGHEHWVKCVAFTRDGAHLVTCGLDRKMFVWRAKGVSDTNSGPKHSLAFHKDYVLDLAPLGSTRMISTSKDGVTLVWNALTGKMNERLEHAGNSHCIRVCVTSDAKYIVAAFFDNTVCVYSTRDLRLLRRIRVHNEGILSLAITESRNFCVGTAGGRIQSMSL